MELSNCYELLGVKRNATAEQIKKAYRKSALIHHPDKGGDVEQFKKLSKALDTLTDPKKRAAYDQYLTSINSKDGTRTYRREETKETTANPPQRHTTQPPPKTFTEIPSNPEQLSVKELKNLLNSLGIKHDDCVEKSELLARLKERKTAPKRFHTTNAPPPPPSGDSLSIKILSIGDPECGKSCIIKRYCEGRFVQRYISTIGVDYGVKKMNIQGKKVAVNFFDLSGQKDYSTIRQDFYKDSQGVILVFELNDQSTFANIVRWEREARANGLNLAEVNVIVCGNKADANGREVSASEANKFAASRGYKYFEVSACTGTGIGEALDYLFAQVVTKISRNKENLLRNIM